MQRKSPKKGEKCDATVFAPPSLPVPQTDGAIVLSGVQAIAVGVDCGRPESGLVRVNQVFGEEVFEDVIVVRTALVQPLIAAWHV